MKKFLAIFFMIAVVIMGLCGCHSLNHKPVTLADNISIPQNGVIKAAVLEELKNENKAVTFTGESHNIHYEWVIFGSDIKNTKDLNLGIEIIEVSDDQIVFRYLSDKNFGFSPALSIHLKGLWNAPSASVCEKSNTKKAEKQWAAITGTKQSILNFSPKTQTGTYIITKDVEPNETVLPEALAAQTPNETVPLGTSVDPASNQTALPEVSAAPMSDNITSENQQSSQISEKPQEPTLSGTQDISDGKQTKQDQYKTDPIPEGRPLPAEPEEQTPDTRKTYTCTFSIECSTILNNLGGLEQEKLDILPKNGVILAPQTVTFYEGESVYDVLQRVCQEKNIHLEASWTPMYNSAYVEGIHNLYEFDCGSSSGWMYRVDGWYPNYGCSRYLLKQGETVEWRYSCDLGKDIGKAESVNK